VPAEAPCGFAPTVGAHEPSDSLAPGRAGRPQGRSGRAGCRRRAMPTPAASAG
jgi:hypothetical protein